jgi:hypothetical protein
VLAAVTNNVFLAIFLITCVSCICHRSKHLPRYVELHSGNQSHVEPMVSTIAEIATFEPNCIMVCSVFYTMFSSLHSQTKSIDNRV